MHTTLYGRPVEGGTLLLSYWPTTWARVVPNYTGEYVRMDNDQFRWALVLLS